MPNWFRTYNYVGLSSSKVASPKTLPEGKVTIRYEFVCYLGIPLLGFIGALKRLHWMLGTRRKPVKTPDLIALIGASRSKIGGA